MRCQHRTGADRVPLRAGSARTDRGISLAGLEHEDRRGSQGHQYKAQSDIKQRQDGARLGALPVGHMRRTGRMADERRAVDARCHPDGARQARIANEGALRGNLGTGNRWEVLQGLATAPSWLERPTAERECVSNAQRSAMFHVGEASGLAFLGHLPRMKARTLDSARDEIVYLIDTQGLRGVSARPRSNAVGFISEISWFLVRSSFQNLP